MLRAGLDTHPDPAEAVEAVAALLAQALADSDWRDGCPVTATALETVGRLPELQAACAQAFASWQHLVAAKLLASGYPEPEARDLAMTVINTLEGAEMTSQVTASRTPLLVAGRHLARLISSYGDFPDAPGALSAQVLSGRTGPKRSRCAAGGPRSARSRHGPSDR